MNKNLSFSQFFCCIRKIFALFCGPLSPFFLSQNIANAKDAASLKFIETVDEQLEN